MSNSVPKFDSRVGWADLSWLPGFHPAPLSLHVSQDKGRDIACLNGQNRLNLRKINLLLIKMDLYGEKQGQNLKHLLPLFLGSTSLVHSQLFCLPPLSSAGRWEVRFVSSLEQLIPVTPASPFSLCLTWVPPEAAGESA